MVSRDDMKPQSETATYERLTAGTRRVLAKAARLGTAPLTTEQARELDVVVGSTGYVMVPVGAGIRQVAFSAARAWTL